MAGNEHVDMSASGADRTAERLAAVPGIRRAPTPKLEQFMLPGFLDPESCPALIAQIDRDVRPSTIADPNGYKAFRTSTTCDLDHRDPIVIAVHNRPHDLTGIPSEYGDRKSVVDGKSVSSRVDNGCRRTHKQNKKK